MLAQRNSNGWSKRNRLVRDIPVDCLVSNQENISIVWFNSMLAETDLSDLSFTHLRTLNDYILFYTQKSLYLEYLMSKHKQNDYIIVIVHDIEILDQTQNCEQVRAILLIMTDDDKNKNIITERDYKKVVGIIADQNSIFVKLQQIIVDVEHQVAQNVGDVFSTFNRQERTLRDVRHELAVFMWRQVFKIMVKTMPHTLEARQELIDQCRLYYNGNQSQLAQIDEFERNYNAINAVRWYTKSCFLFRSLNKALRTEDVGSLYIFRYFINDLCTILEAAHDDKRNIIQVYRGGQMSKDEIENYSVGTIVAANGFLSTSRDLQVAQLFIGLDMITGKSPSQSRDDQQQFVLFIINTDWDRSPDINVADISNQSDFPDENEVLFDMGTTFEITAINYDWEQYLWHIEMQPSMEIAQLNREYEHYIHQRLAETNSTLLFGILLTDMGEYEQSANYFQHLLAKMPDNHEDRPNVYYSAARIYRFTNQYEKALKFLRHAELLQRARLPESNFDLARTLAGIASVYYELQDYQQELFYYQQSMNIYQKILPENHIEIARTFNRLGFAYANQKQYTLALTYLSKSLFVYNNTVPEVHPDKAFLLYNTGLVHHRLGHIAESFDFYEKALKMRETTLPPYHPYIGQSCYQLSVLCEEQSQYDLALEYAYRALTIYEKKPSNNHKMICDVQNIIKRLHNESNVQI
ncbi:unnamed protein product [Rotaria sordida]|uniref:NAD(P)(+)--arginine ADP-ribosyltransferase n=1 Tax=Rotaria sordida TaxID=392033 RepID=A0A819TDU3_9BILA|nr:unnamed protein product [Rotaria sordida]CAF4086320.1 unnamed protein product [Rotaria sordida]